MEARDWMAVTERRAVTVGEGGKKEKNYADAPIIATQKTSHSLSAFCALFVNLA